MTLLREQENFLGISLIVQPALKLKLIVLLANIRYDYAFLLCFAFCLLHVFLLIVAYAI
jgi:hypothetical protein